jgi:hypothetical protein
VTIQLAFLCGALIGVAICYGYPLIPAQRTSGQHTKGQVQDPSPGKLAEAQAALQVVEAINAHLCNALATRAVNDALEGMKPQAAAVARAKTSGSAEKLQ